MWTEMALALVPTALLMALLARAPGRGMRPLLRPLLAGAAATVPACALSMAAEAALGMAVPEDSVARHVLRYLLCVALAEEAAKRAALTRAHGSVGGDVALASVAVGLGFGAVEDALYVARGTSWLPRALTCASGHAAFGLLMGMALERGRPRLALLLPTLAHGAYDALVRAEGPAAVPCTLVALAYVAVANVAVVRALRGRGVTGRETPLPTPDPPPAGSGSNRASPGGSGF